MGSLYSFGFVMALAWVAFFYKGGEQETGSGLPWAGLSIVLSAVVLLVWNGGFWAVLFAQLGLLLGITLFRLWRDPH